MGSAIELTASKMKHDQALMSIVSYLESHSLVTRLIALVMYYEVQTRKTLKATGVAILIKAFSSSGDGIIRSQSFEVYSSRFEILVLEPGLCLRALSWISRAFAFLLRMPEHEVKSG
jgi:hypothetical protein